MIKIIAAMCVGLLLTGCTSNTTTESPQPSARTTYTSISTSDATFAPMMGAKFSWYTPAVTWAATGPTDNFQAIESLAKSTIERALTERGFVITHSQLDADYIIGMVIASSDYNETQDFAHYFGLSSGLNAHNERTAQAMLGVISKSSLAIQPPLPNSLLWKASLETQILSEETPENIRQARAKLLFEQLISSMPTGK